MNPYLAKPDLSAEQLLKYVEKMRDKPKSIQGRPGFAAAMVDACDRILAFQPPASDAQLLAATEYKLAAIHHQACAGDEAADKQLAELAKQLHADPRPRLAHEAKFLMLETKVLQARDLPVVQIPPLLKEVLDFSASEKMTAKHLRLASSTVALINKIENGDEREKYFSQFGALFAKSSDKQLARYGRKLAEKPETSESDLIGQPLELAGSTAKGNPFPWESYRGKVVIVDFWATWCGPCRKEMPHMKELYERLHAKGLEVVGVSLDQDEGALADYLAENQIPWETLAGDGVQELAKKYGVRGIPSLMLVDKQGKIIAVAHQLDTIVPEAEKLLDK